MNYMQNNIDKILETRSEHLEMFAAAFVKEVGSLEASRYRLVEVQDGNKITWEFELR
jgi:hypothetical protein